MAARRMLLCLCFSVEFYDGATVTSKSFDEDIELPLAPTTEQIMDARIKTINLPDVNETDDSWMDPNWDRRSVVLDVAYYLRAHKFHDYDRRYYTNVKNSPNRLYEEFPRPGLRALHWEVLENCDTSFLVCLKYLESVIRLTGLRRQDDTVTVMKEQKWSQPNNEEQISAVQKDCQMAQRRDNLTNVPFQGPIERFQWRTSVSYYMCWYTMLGRPELALFGESCDNHANCLDEFGLHNRDPRANDSRAYACALYSFCPDHCCPMKHVLDMKDCYQSPLNPCYSENDQANRKCTLHRVQNQHFESLMANRINVSCHCPQSGYEWSSRFGICVDVDECATAGHNCSIKDHESCINLPGRFECICQFGYLFDPKLKRCVINVDVQNSLSPPTTSSPSVVESKSLIKFIAKKIRKSLSMI